MTDFAPSVQLNNETLDFFTESLELDQSVFPKLRMKSRLMNAESSVHPDAQECPIQLGAETYCGEKCLISWKCVFFGLLQNVMMMRLMMNG